MYPLLFLCPCVLDELPEAVFLYFAQRNEKMSSLEERGSLGVIAFAVPKYRISS